MAARDFQRRRRSSGVLAVATCACAWLLAAVAFLPGPQAPAPPKIEFQAAAAISGALPAMTLLADSADATYGVEVRRWNIILMPLVTLVVPAIAFGSFVLYSF
eukprot:CAMPEP_0117487428 /NCGR_PEP_ID=MMETSP0784-20121206/15990_1 /TAXON_ID=39447 /ORGANISM="" /LENGTH=102 /DNA_ID=CAMNT_0005282075 /DNA_START=23 /DNA_END=328 /DNA_ORIENTATION=+